MKDVLARFRLDIDYSGDFCGLVRETLICFSIVSRLRYFGYIWRKSGQRIQRNIILGFEDILIDKDFVYFVQLTIIKGKLHTHKNKWTDSRLKPNLEQVCHEIYEYCTIIKTVKHKKADNITLCQI